MVIAPLPHNEEERLKALYRTELLDSAYEQDFDDIVKLASRICRTPFCVISLIDSNRQWYKSHLGMTGREADRDPAFCTHAILQDEFFEVRDALKDERFHDNPFVTGDPFVRYYGGVPLVTNDGFKLGTLCVFDSEPRKLDDDQTLAMNTLAKQVMKLVDMRMMNKNLQQANHVQQRTISILAHDIRNPLASISSVYELKTSGSLSDNDVAELDAMIPLQVQSTLDLLNNVVQWGSIQLKDKEEEQNRTSVAEVIDSCFAVIALQAAEKNIELKTDGLGDLYADVDEASLSFIFRNLLTNACKYTHDGVISVSGTFRGNSIIVSVTDTGLGMSEMQLKALRDRSNINSSLGTNNEKGNGLGISLIYETLSTIKGNLEIESEKGKGSTFKVKLPKG